MANLFKKAESTQAFIKAGVLGFSGSGKTYTTMQMVFGLKEMIKSTAPICFFDTESGSDFFINKCKERGIELYQIKGRAFVDAVVAFDAAKQLGADILIFDSITHIWRELCESYKQKKARTRLQFQDWDFLKGPGGWAKFTDLFLNAPIHTFICGRAGYEWEYEEIDGKKELTKTGTKMKAESEFGYEPSLVIEMVREKLSSSAHPDAKGWSHKAYVLKDRTDTINGQVFEFTHEQVRNDPSCVFKAVQPHFANLNIGGTQMGIDLTRTSDELFTSEGEPKAEWFRKQKQIALEEFKALLEGEWVGNAEAMKAKRRDIFAAVCKFLEMTTTASWTAFEALSLNDVRRGHVCLIDLINADRAKDKREDFLETPQYEGITKFGADETKAEDGGAA